nr:hypothetical protein Iba_chr15bCG9260 [Ipomoea batatas]
MRTASATGVRSGRAAALLAECAVGGGAAGTPGGGGLAGAQKSKLGSVGVGPMAGAAPPRGGCGPTRGLRPTVTVLLKQLSEPVRKEELIRRSATVRKGKPSNDDLIEENKSGHNSMRCPNDPTLTEKLE